MEICLFVQDILDIQKKPTTIQSISEYFTEVNAIAKSNILSLLAKTEINMSTFLLMHDVSNVEFSHVDFNNTVFRGEIIQNLSFENTQFYNVTFKGVTFTNCDFSGGIFEKCTLEDVKFYNCDFVSSKWKNANLFRCVFSSISEYMYSNYYIIDDFQSSISDLEGCNLINSSWLNSFISDCMFYNCPLVTATMHSMNIQETTFEYVDFSGIKISGSLNFERNALIETTGEPYEF